MRKIKITRQRKLKISNNIDDDPLTVEIGKSAVDNGLLKHLPDSTLAIFLYLVTHLEKGMYVQTNPVIISSYLPDKYNVETIKKGLNYLSRHDIINISDERDGGYTSRIYLNLHKLEELTSSSGGESTGEELINKEELRHRVINKPSVSRQELIRALVTFIPSGKEIALTREKINHWLDDFDSRMIQELIRRVDKWIQQNNNPPEQAFNYLQGIIADWYRKEITSYKRLKYFDQLYRETKDLAYTYGITNWQNLKPVHMETFKRWLSEDFALSISIAKFAIKEAIRRKKDGQPSLKYIEDNFILPWKKAGIKSVEEARAFMAKQANKPSGPEKKTAKNKKKTRKRWDKFYKNFEDYRET